jgi:hypothetical protein
MIYQIQFRRGDRTLGTFIVEAETEGSGDEEYIIPIKPPKHVKCFLGQLDIFATWTPYLPTSTQTDTL